MMTCKELAEISSASIDLTFTQQIEFHFHAFICSACSNYLKHLKIVTLKYHESHKQFKKENAEEISKIEKEILDQVTK